MAYRPCFFQNPKVNFPEKVKSKGSPNNVLVSIFNVRTVRIFTVRFFGRVEGSRVLLRVLGVGKV